MTATQQLNWMIVLALGALSVECAAEGATDARATVEQTLDDGGGATTSAQPYKACTAKDQCESNMPTCAHGTTYVCGKTAHECAYYLKNVTGCNCIEGVIRECPLSGGSMGVQRCNELGTDKTNWGACGTLAEALDDG